MASPGKGGKGGGSKGGSRTAKNSSDAKPSFKAETSPARAKRSIVGNPVSPAQAKIAGEKTKRADKMRIIRTAKRKNALKKLG